MSGIRLRVAALVFVLLTGSRLASADFWEVDLEHALQQARTDQRMILMDFTGSDWCGWCKRLEAEVLATVEFETYARQKLICVRLDFPRGYSLPAQRARSNNELALRYGVKGFPTVILLNSDGAEIGRTGYQPGGASAYIQHLESLLAPHRNKTSPLEAVKKLFVKPAEAAATSHPENRLWLNRNGEAVEGRLTKRDGENIHILTRKGESIILRLADLDAEDRAFIEQSVK